MIKRSSAAAAMALFAIAAFPADAYSLWLYPWSPAFVSQAYPVTVNYDQTAGQLVDAIGYDEYDVDIPDYQAGPTFKEPEKATCRLVVFSPLRTAEENLEFLEESGWQPASFEALAAFSMAYPEARLAWNLVALGSEWRTADGRRYAPLIGWYWETGRNDRWRRRTIGLVRRDYLWTEEIDGPIAVVVVERMSGRKDDEEK